MNVGQWTDGDSWFVTQGTTGGLRSWHRAQGRDHRESPSLWLRKAVPDWSLPLCQGGGQAWAHRPSWYLLATWQALNMSCYCSVPPSQFVKGNSVKRPRGKIGGLCSVVSACTVVRTYADHTSSPKSPEQDHNGCCILIRHKNSQHKKLQKLPSPPTTTTIFSRWIPPCVWHSWITVAVAAGWCTLLILPPRAPTASSAHATVIEAICSVAVW